MSETVPCKTESDEDPLSAEFEAAIAGGDTSGLAAIASVYRARWCEAKGQLKSIERAIASKDYAIALLVEQLGKEAPADA